MVDKLFETSDQSFATLNLASGEIKPGPTDLKGPFTLGVAGTYYHRQRGRQRFVRGCGNFRLGRERIPRI